MLHRFLLLLVALGCSLSAEDVWLPHPAADSTDRKLAQALRIERARPATVARNALLQAGATPDQLRVRLDVAVTAANLAAISATGATVVSTAERWHEVVVDATVDQLGALAALPAVAQVKPLLKPFRRVTGGTFTDGADTVLGVASVRAAHGVDGAGQKLGILSDSLHFSTAVGNGTVSGSVPDATLTGTAPQLTGDLPTSIQVIDFGDATEVGDSDEGAAMMELAYHLAPGADYAFASCGSSETTFAANIASLAHAGCSIICDDVGFFAEPMFQDGPVAQAVDAAAAGGAIYLSSAGNAGDAGILATYHDVSASTDPHAAGTYPTGDDFHDWGIGGSTPGYLPITITPTSSSGGGITVVLQWNQPFASYGLGRGSATDYDMLLLSSTATPSSATALAGSGDVQGTSSAPSGDPVEILSYGTFTPRTVYLAVDRFNAELSDTSFRIVIMASGCSVTLPSTTIGYPAATIYGHPAAAGALAIGAVPVTSPTTIEYFSSRGGWGSDGLPFYFSTSGTALSGAPVRRNKPDLVAPDGTATSLPHFTPFYGTSAAAPHAAAAFAVLWQLLPDTPRQGLIDLVENSATDLTTTPASSGDDAWSGHGLISASAAASGVISSPGCTLGGASSGTVGTALAISVTFSTAVTGFTASDLTVTNGTVTALDGSGASYVATVLPAAVGTLTVAVPAGAASASDGGASRAAAGLVVAIAEAGSGPTCTLSGATSGTVGTALVLTATFSAPVTGFAAADLTVTNGTILAVGGTGANYTVTVIPSAAGLMTVAVAAGAASASGGGLSQAASLVVTIAGVAHGPSCAMGGRTGGTVGTAQPITVAFSAAVTGFTSDDVTVTNGTITALNGSGVRYVAQVVPSAVGLMTVEVVAGAASAADGSTSQAATFHVTVSPGSAVALVPSTSGGGGGACGLGGGLALLALWPLLRLRSASRRDQTRG